ncbi:MAG: peptidylprolyl isomerase [cyanobacterium endosymbiont of Rhopalodia musculus]|uniref:peptidylprolyl isomerase n=1 Tax=cyanobacterium endosymbiont of Epithemia clementina EcSB TaxID=3034674 RepID=UPI00247FEF26|nr:peptidylprolyl isomerase [cyanobacterium endosymbiont of Epithemia clementina EcSB]WGT67741.1 peptidylprolyl isomerase [cyanobacterium endosymbiont of Epithemia clementina EcSB]
MKKLLQRWSTILACLVLVSGLILTGCSSPSATSSDVNTSENLTRSMLTDQGNQLDIDNYVPRLEGKAIVEMIIKGSPVTIEVNGQDAPVTAGNFVDLVNRGFYNGLTFHRVVKEPQPFVAQGGDPQGTGTGSFIDPDTKKTRYVPLEIKLEGDEKPFYSKALGRQGASIKKPVVLPHTRGAVAMARSQMPDTASSQFYFALSDLTFLDGDYAVFAYVTQGMDTVDSIKQGDHIDSAKVIVGLENLKQ